jgi:hypothetical protein
VITPDSHAGVPAASSRTRWTGAARPPCRAAVGLALALSILATVPSAQTEFGVTEIADYRLSADVFAQFDRASRLIASVTRADPRFEREPLFTEEMLLTGDVLPMAVALEARLRSEMALADALRTANLTPHAYAKFTLALVAARLAHGFVKSGVIRSVPPGVHADNVAFVDANQADVEAVLRELGLE